MMNHILFLESRLSKYEQIASFDPDSVSSYSIINYKLKDKLEDIIETKKRNVFIDEEDEKHQQIISKIGEGATSIAFKVIDNRTSEVMCKKVLKVEEGTTEFKDFQNITKEFEVLNSIEYPTICKAIGIN